MSRDLFRISLHKSGNQAVANDVAAYPLRAPSSDGADRGERLKVTGVAVYLGNIGGTSGQTTVDVKKNGTSILAAPLSVAYNASQKYVTAGVEGLAPNANSYGGGEPSGVDCFPGDYLRADVTAIPGTPSADLSVYLICETRLT